MKNQPRFILNRLGLTLLLYMGLLVLSGCYSYTVPNRIFTPVPTLIPVSTLNPLALAAGGAVHVECPIRPVDLLGAWVGAGIPETDSFEFTSEEGQTCTASYPNDVEKVFNESNLWFEGSPACISCHHSDLDTALQRMDLSSYAGILAGSQRPSAEETGNDILGGGDWEESRLHFMLINKLMPPGRPDDSHEKGPVIFAGNPVGE
jgi:hypothetical protein